MYETHPQNEYLIKRGVIRISLSHLSVWERELSFNLIQNRAKKLT